MMTPKWLSGLGGYIALACAAIGAWYANNVFQQKKGAAKVKAKQNEQSLKNIKRAVEIERETENLSEDELDAIAVRNGWVPREDKS